MLPWTIIVLDYVCPTIGAIMASAMFAAPLFDLRQALAKGSLGILEPFPWAVMTGNCLGWCAYGYYRHDPFVLAANLPGLVLSIWLNIGAAKLQYLAKWEDHLKEEGGQNNPANDVDNDDIDQVILVDEDAVQNDLITVPQERALLRCLIFWSCVLVYAGWCSPSSLDPGELVGVVVNINLVFFYGAPLRAMNQVVRGRHSDAIHRPTMIMSWTNTTFWLLYGASIKDFVIVIPNACGLFLGIGLGILCLIFPKSATRTEEEVSVQSLLEDETDEEAHAENLVV